MIERYTLKEMGQLWTELHKKSTWLRVALADLWAKEKLGYAPPGVYEANRHIEITEEVLRRADEIEKQTDHDLIAWLEAVNELLNEIAKIYFYVGLTSFAIEDTALVLILRDSLDLICEKMEHLRQVLLKRAEEHRYTLEIGRTHFIHAGPITFGFKLLTWVDVIERHIKRLKVVREEISVGKFSGAVGLYDIDPKIEELACEHLELWPARISTQILSRDLLVHYSMVLIGIANSLDRFATEVRHLSGTDICEVAEFKKPGSKGSSAMPGKSRLGNPIKSENVCGLAKAARGYYIPALECEIVWNERSLDNSAAERIYLPDLTILVDFALQRFADTMEKLEVFPEQMEQNIWRTGGIVFAQRVMIALTKKGMVRKDAYDLLEGLALLVKRGPFRTENGETFQDLVRKDQTINRLLSLQEIDECFDPKAALKNIDYIFKKFGL